VFFWGGIVPSRLTLSQVGKVAAAAEAVVGSGTEGHVGRLGLGRRRRRLGALFSHALGAALFEIAHAMRV